MPASGTHEPCSRWRGPPKCPWPAAGPSPLAATMRSRRSGARTPTISRRSQTSGAVGSSVRGTAVDLLLESLDADTTLLTLGPLTNVAEAVRADRGIAGRVGRVVAMAGAIDVVGTHRTRSPSSTCGCRRPRREGSGRVVAGGVRPARRVQLRPGHAVLRRRARAEPRFRRGPRDHALLVTNPQIEAGTYYFWDAIAALWSTRDSRPGTGIGSCSQPPRCRSGVDAEVGRGSRQVSLSARTPCGSSASSDDDHRAPGRRSPPPTGCGYQLRRTALSHERPPTPAGNIVIACEPIFGCRIGDAPRVPRHDVSTRAPLVGPGSVVTKPPRRIEQLALLSGDKPWDAGDGSGNGVLRRRRRVLRRGSRRRGRRVSGPERRSRSSRSQHRVTRPSCLEVVSNQHDRPVPLPSSHAERWRRALSRAVAPRTAR